MESQTFYVALRALFQKTLRTSRFRGSCRTARQAWVQLAPHTGIGPKRPYRPRTIYVIPIVIMIVQAFGVKEISHFDERLPSSVHDHMQR